MKAFTVNVGINTARDCLGKSAPIYANGTFDYIPIPRSDEEIVTYRLLGLTSTFERMRISNRLDEGVHNDPEFISFTYGDFPTTISRVSNLQEIGRGDFLLFIASLIRTKHEQLGSHFEDWITLKRGMYLIGGFKIGGILTKNGERLNPRAGKTKFSRNPHFEWLQDYPDDDSWIFKGSKKSALFPVAVPLRRKDVEELYEIRLPNSRQSETAQVNSYTRTAREVINVDYLREIVSEKCPTIELFDE